MKQGLEELKYLKRKKAELEQKIRTVEGQIEETTIDLVGKWKLSKQKTKPKRLTRRTMKKQYTLDEDGFVVETIGSKYGPKKPCKKRLTMGMRVRILTLAELSKKLGKKCKSADYYWNHYDGGKHALLQERSSGSGDFSILIIGKKWKNERFLPKETTGVIDGGGAWVNEDVMEFVNADFDVNLDYMDWYQEHENDFCGDCGIWREDKDPCPNKDCPGNHLEEYYDAID
jgi:hypothetical protein